MTADGEFAICVQLADIQLGDLRSMWALVATKLVEARRCLLNGQSHSMLSPSDGLHAWLNPQFWIPAQTGRNPLHHAVRYLARLLRIRSVAATNVLTDEIRLKAEQDASVMVTEQIGPAVLCVLRCLRKDIFDILCLRHDLSLSMTHCLLEQARQHGPDAVRYTLQALRTESLSLLHLAASENPAKESQQIRKAIFKGVSLPNKLAEIGVSKAAHRRSIAPSSRGCAHLSDAMGDLIELPLAGAHWLTIQRIVKERMPSSEQDWASLRRLVNSLASLDIRDPATSANLFLWCTRSGYTRSGNQFDGLVSQARAIQNAAARHAHSDLTIDQALEFAMSDGLGNGNTLGNEIAPLPRGAGQIALLAARITGQSIEQLTKVLLDAHPGLPSDLQVPSDTAIVSLNSLFAVVSHGTACGNCLRDAARAIQYLADGLALYSVSVKGRIEGTIALRGYRTHWYRKVIVREVTGVDNADPSPDLISLAATLANGWSSDEQMAAWFSYERASEEWKRSME